MDLKEFATMIDGKEYKYPQFSDDELQIAKDNGYVIVSGSSDDLMELDGAITDEGDCWEGKIFTIKAVRGGGIINCQNRNTLAESSFEIKCKWCKKRDPDGKIIPWSYEIPKDIEHVEFMIYEDKNPYCQGVIFKIKQ